MRRILLAALFAAMLLPGLAAAGNGDTLITDPDLLERLGFPRDARDVYLAKGAVLDQRSSPAEPEEFGTTDLGWTTVLGNQHQPIGSNAIYVSVFGTGSLSHHGGTHVFDAQLHVPSGALLQQVVWFGRDDDAGTGGLLFGQAVRVCQTMFPHVEPPLVTILGGNVSTTGEFTFVVVVPPGEVVNNLSCAYIARTHFMHSVGGETEDLELRKVRAGWQRQVSPAPVTATFPNDTPTTHPFFQFVEALAASGITAGCAPQSFCPEAPITRGQMAVFLSVALGLHFPN